MWLWIAGNCRLNHSDLGYESEINLFFSPSKNILPLTVKKEPYTSFVLYSSVNRYIGFVLLKRAV